MQTLSYYKPNKIANYLIRWWLPVVILCIGWRWRVSACRTTGGALCGGTRALSTRTSSRRSGWWTWRTSGGRSAWTWLTVRSRWRIVATIRSVIPVRIRCTGLRCGGWCRCTARRCIVLISEINYKLTLLFAQLFKIFNMHKYKT